MPTSVQCTRCKRFTPEGQKDCPHCLRDGVKIPLPLPESEAPFEQAEECSISQRIEAACDSIKRMLLDKNARYGNSALDPVRIFSQASPREQILVRIDDKLSRLKRGVGLDEAGRNDAIRDLIGYLILLQISEED